MKRLVICVLIAEVILISLGVWQLKRLAWKEELLTSIAQTAEQPPLALNEANATFMKRQKIVYQPVKVQGQLLCDKQIFVGIRTYQSVPGYHVLMPLKFQYNDGAGDHYIMVNLGWINATRYDNFALPQNFCENSTTLAGVITKPGRSNIFTPKPKGVLWYAVDLPQLKTYANLPLMPYLIRQTNILVAGIAPLDKSINLPNRHLEYALTWFSFAGVLLIMAIILGVVEIRGKR